MPENTQIPGAQNPSKADTSYLDYESAWKAFNYIQFIVKNLPSSTYEEAIQAKVADIQLVCTNIIGGLYVEGIPGSDQLSPSDAAKLMIPFAQQLQTSANTGIANLGGFIRTWCQSIEEY
jgi:hypothetical protein